MKLSQKRNFSTSLYRLDLEAPNKTPFVLSLRGGEADEAISKPEIAAPAKSTSGLAMTILLGTLNNRTFAKWPAGGVLPIGDSQYFTAPIGAGHLWENHGTACIISAKTGFDG